MPKRKQVRKEKTSPRRLSRRASRSKEEPRVVLLPVHPYLVHAYWDVPPRRLAQIKKELGKNFGGARAALRFLDVTDMIFDGQNARQTFDIPIDLAAGNWYVHLWSPGKSYCVDLGYNTEGGGFFRIARSNIAETPPAFLAEEMEPQSAALPQTETAASPLAAQRKISRTVPRREPGEVKRAELPSPSSPENSRETPGAISATDSKDLVLSTGPESKPVAREEQDLTKSAEEKFHLGISSPLFSAPPALFKKDARRGGDR